MAATEKVIDIPCGEPTVRPYLVECEFTVEHRTGLCGATSDKSVTFRGYATDALYDTLMNSVKEVLRDSN